MPFLPPGHRFLQNDQVQPGFRGDTADIGGAVGVSARRSQGESIAGTLFDGGAEQAAGAQSNCRRAHDRDKVADIDQHVGGNHQIPGGWCPGDSFDQFGYFQMIVDAPAAGLLHHARRQIRTVKTVGQRAERDPGKTGAASHIQHVHSAGHDPRKLVHHGAKHLRSLILQPDRQVVVEAFGIAVEQSSDIGMRHRFSGIAFDAVDQGLYGGRIGWAGVQTAMQCGDRLLPLAQFKPRAPQGQLTGC